MASADGGAAGRALSGIAVACPPAAAGETRRGGASAAGGAQPCARAAAPTRLRVGRERAATLLDRRVCDSLRAEPNAVSHPLDTGAGATATGAAAGGR